MRDIVFAYSYEHIRRKGGTRISKKQWKIYCLSLVGHNGESVNGNMLSIWNSN